MQELFIKYLNNECSPEEVKALLEYFNNPENENMLRQLIAESLENTNSEDDGSPWKTDTDLVYADIKKRLHAGKGKVVPISGRPWLRVAAAVVVLAGGFAVYSLITNKNEKQDITSANTSKQEIEPGRTRAVLTLADESTIILESAANGILTQQGDTKIVKLADGRVAYNAAKSKATEALYNSIATPRGGEYQLILSDGTKVWLNAASSLRFPATFIGTERRVQLSGEAYFEVAKNASMPFKVEAAGKGVVEVLGTHFNINAYGDEGTVSTTLLEGQVKVMALSTQDAHILAPGEQALLDGHGQISIDKNADTEQAIAWKNGAFNFSNADLGMVLRQLSRWYDVDIKFEGPLQKRQFNGEIQRDLKLSQVLKILEKNNVFCRLEGKTLIVLN